MVGNNCCNTESRKVDHNQLEWRKKVQPKKWQGLNQIRTFSSAAKSLEKLWRLDVKSEQWSTLYTFANVCLKCLEYTTFLKRQNSFATIRIFLFKKLFLSDLLLCFMFHYLRKIVSLRCWKTNSCQLTAKRNFIISLFHQFFCPWLLIKLMCDTIIVLRNICHNKLCNHRTFDRGFFFKWCFIWRSKNNIKAIKFWKHNNYFYMAFFYADTEFLILFLENHIH